MKQISILIAFLTCLFSASAQTVTVTSQHLGGLTPLTGTITWQPTNCAGQNASVKMGGGGQTSMQPVTVPVTNGAFTLTLPDGSFTNPMNIGYTVTAHDAKYKYVLGPGYSCVQPSSSNYWFANGADDFDNYVPNLAPVALVSAGATGAQGIQGEKGDKGDTGAPGANGAAGPNTVTESTTTTINGLLKGNGANVSVATAGTDYQAALGYTPAHKGANSDITSLTGITTIIPTSEGGTGALGAGYAYANGSSPYTFSTTIPYGSISGIPAKAVGDYSSFYCALTGCSLTGELSEVNPSTGTANLLSLYGNAGNWAGYIVQENGNNVVMYAQNQYSGTAAFLSVAPSAAAPLYGGVPIWTYGVGFSCAGGFPNSACTSAVIQAVSSGVFNVSGALNGSTPVLVNFIGTINATSEVQTPLILPTTLYKASGGTALPTCAAGTKGVKATVQDGAATPTFMGAYSGGGANTVPVFCNYNGTTYAWLYF